MFQVLQLLFINRKWSVYKSHLLLYNLYTILNLPLLTIYQIVIIMMIDRLTYWCLTPTLVVFQLSRGVHDNAFHGKLKLLIYIIKDLVLNIWRRKHILLHVVCLNFPCRSALLVQIYKLLMPNFYPLSSNYLFIFIDPAPFLHLHGLKLYNHSHLIQ